MSGYSTTPNLGLKKPVTGADDDLWGTHLNDSLDILDTVIGPLTASSVTSVAGKTGAVTLVHTDITDWTAALGPYALSTTVPLASTAPPLMDGTATVGTSALYAREGHIHPTDTSRYAAANPADYQTAVQVKAGTTTNDNATTGQIGEYISASVAVGSALPMASDVAKTITSISLTAGDWDMSANVTMNPAGTTIPGYITCSISLTNNTHAAAPNGGGFAQIFTNQAAGASNTLPLTTMRLSLAATTTVYLVAQLGFATSTCSAYGFIGARRAR